MADLWRMALGALLLTALIGCTQDPSYTGGCLAGAAGCVPSPPCPALTFTCDDPSLAARVLTAPEAAGFQGGLGRAAQGDLLLSNARVAAVISGPRNAQDRDLAGGALIDLFARAPDGGWAPDPLQQAVQAVGPGPAQLALHTDLRLLEEDGRVGVVAAGSVAGHPTLRLHTLYELRPCDPGVRIRTEVINEGPDPLPLATGDRIGWSAGASALAPSWALLSVQGRGSSLAQVACNQPSLHGAQETRSAQGGSRPTLVGPRDFQVFERFIAAGTAEVSAADHAREVRAQLFDEPAHRVFGRVLEADGRAPAEGTAWIRLSVDGGRVAQTRADAQGAFRLVVPGDSAYTLSVERLGVLAVTQQLPLVDAPLDLGSVTLPSAAHLTVDVTDGSGGALAAELVFVPEDASTTAAVTGVHPEDGRPCAPVLGAPGGAPGCGRIAGASRLELLPGVYRVLAHHGPFWGISTRTLTLPAGDSTLSFVLPPLTVRPPDLLSAELHLHTEASPSVASDDATTARELLARELEVTVATNSGLAAQPRLDAALITLPGGEFAPSVPFLEVPGRDLPVTPGRMGMWPLRLEPGAARNGLPRDEGIEPGAFLQRLIGHYAGVHVVQLQHPWLGQSEAGEWLGFARAIGLDARRALPPAEDGTANGLFVTNHGYHAQEVFSGAVGEQLLAQRALWFYLLNQGVLRTGTASGFSHRADDLRGVPRSLVARGAGVGPLFDADGFNESVRRGHLLGTNGPIIEAQLVLPGDVRRPYGFQVHSGPGVANLAVKVSAAPWIPVEELRVVVNGQVARTVPLSPPADPLGTADTVRFDGLLNVGELVAGVTGDVWIVLEAGAPLPLSADLGGGPDGQPDGIPDTSDNDGNGVVDAADVQGPDAVGPLRAPADASAAGLYFRTAFPGAGPYAFTNPFLLDRTANGQFDPPGLTGGRQP
ncbi:MAG: hypothetical protein M3Y59_14145 [Myxococcota bacterium]|nr:hypothetical protein [Myxococcota bacterium]